MENFNTVYQKTKMESFIELSFYFFIITVLIVHIGEQLKNKV